MRDILEFVEQEIPENNPNEPNDIYKVDGVKGSDIDCIWLIIIFILYTIAGFVFLALFISSVINGGSGKDLFYVLIFAVASYFGVAMVYKYIKALYRKYPYRKKIFTNGKSYPGIVSEVIGYTRQVGAAVYGSLELQEYAINIKYADTSMVIKGLEGYPGKYLENPYCTVYVWEGKAIATDFKVREQYIAPNGKEYLLEPIKKKAKR